ncbi:MAG: hypothetical protein IPO48_04525 [Saprospiraceae bacterium]|nr:hypothetical protein [Saprospiraceae bacterium]
MQIAYGSLFINILEILQYEQEMDISTLYFYYSSIHANSACDVCGCAVSGHQLESCLSSEAFCWLGYSYRNLNLFIHHYFLQMSKVSREYFHTTDLWGRFVLGKRIQLFGFIPYQSITKNENEISIAQRGDNVSHACYQSKDLKRKDTAFTGWYQIADRCI